VIPNKKEIYDVHGTETNFRQQYHEYFRDEDDFDPFDFFNIFNEQQFGRHVYRRRRRYPQNHQHQDQRSPFLQLMPLLFILFLTIAFSLGNLNMGPTYSLSKTETHTIELETQTHSVRYFVDSDTYDTILSSSRSRRNIENEIEVDYYRKMNKDYLFNGEGRCTSTTKHPYMPPI
jgi:hypothetical protein